MSRPDGPPYIVLRPHSPSDPDGSHTARALQAYADLTQARTHRKVLYRKLMVLALLAWLLEASALLSRAGLIAALCLIALIAAAAAAGQWRAQKRLGLLISHASTHE